MLHPLAIGLMVVASAPNVAAALEPPSAPTAEIIKKRLAEADAPSCVAVGIVREETTFHFACSEEIGRVLVDQNSIMEIGSISKGLTGLLLADMVRKGEVRLDDPASKHSRPGAKLPTRNGVEITLRDLVTHSASLPFMPPWSPNLTPGDRRNPWADFDVDALYTALALTRLERDIGLSSVYSNFGFMWLSDILGRAGGKPFDVLLEERVLTPLGMTSTTVRLPPVAEARRVVGHNAAYLPAPPIDLDPALAGTGGISSSIADMTRLAEALAGRRDTPLAETIKLALQPLRDGGDFSAHVSYGWWIREHFGELIHWHSGGTIGFSAVLAVDRKARTGSVVISDVRLNRVDDLGFHLIASTWPLRYWAAPMPLAPDNALGYEGRYEISSTFMLTIFNRLGRTYSQGTDQEPVLLKFLGNDRFDSLNVRVSAQLQFGRTSDGKVDLLTLIQGGREKRALRGTVAQP